MHILQKRTKTKAIRGGTYHRRERLAGRAERKRKAGTEAGARIADFLAREQHGALYALEHAVRDCGVRGEHKTGLEAEPEARDTLLAHNRSCDAKEGVVVLRAGLALAFRRADLLASGDDGHGNREDLREGAGDGAKRKLSDSGEAGGGACRVPRSKAFYVRRTYEGVEEEIGIFCVVRFEVKRPDNEKRMAYAWKRC